MPKGISARHPLLQVKEQQARGQVEAKAERIRALEAALAEKGDEIAQLTDQVGCGWGGGGGGPAEERAAVLNGSGTGCPCWRQAPAGRALFNSYVL